MKLIQAVLERHPDVAAYVDTRGQVYLRLKEWKKAIDDFQVSIVQYPNERSIHLGLHEAYSQLGMQELADRHWQIVESLDERLAPRGGQPTREHAPTRDDN